MDILIIKGGHSDLQRERIITHTHLFTTITSTSSVSSSPACISCPSFKMKFQTIVVLFATAASAVSLPVCEQRPAACDAMSKQDKTQCKKKIGTS